MSADTRAERVARIRWEIGKLEEQIREIEGPDRCEVCACMVLGPEVLSFDGRTQSMLCSRYPARVEVSQDYHCHEFRRKP